MQKEIQIEGMSCQHCVSNVTKTLQAVSGVKTVAVDLAAKKAVVEGDTTLDDNLLNEAIDGIGFEVVGITSL